MSQDFYVGDHVVWNVSNGTGLLFVQYAEALSGLIKRNTGITRAYRLADSDEWEIHMWVFERFVDALVEDYQWRGPGTLRSMLGGFLATAVPLVLECGGTLPSLKPESAPPALTAGALGIERPGQGS
ncbi:DUF6086 family protein [Amycolatopsis sp. cg5]|uniref:DUF6086 family protein n=1 Tax=Amycolatopsis sp. cg5 TaxID=3238802 RepID=UPI0035239858